MVFFFFPFICFSVKTNITDAYKLECFILVEVISLYKLILIVYFEFSVCVQSCISINAEKKILKESVTLVSPGIGSALQLS